MSQATPALDSTPTNKGPHDAEQVLLDSNESTAFIRSEVRSILQNEFAFVWFYVYSDRLTVCNDFGGKLNSQTFEKINARARELAGL